MSWQLMRVEPAPPIPRRRRKKQGGYIDPSQGHGYAESPDGDTFAEQLAAALSGQRDRAVGPSFWGARG